MPAGPNSKAIGNVRAVDLSLPETNKINEFKALFGAPSWLRQNPRHTHPIR